MDSQRFDDLSRTLATARSRRGALKTLAGGALGGLLGLVGVREAAAACRAPKKPCEKGRQCCTKRCKRGKCAPCPGGARFVPAPNLLCWRAWGTVGSGNGQLSYPTGVAVGNNGQIYVVDTDNARIQQFTATGGFVRKWGSEGASTGQFNSPHGVAAGAGHVYVADMNNHRIVRVRPL